MATDSVLIFKESARKSYVYLRWILIIVCSWMILLSNNVQVGLNEAHLLVIFLIISNTALHFVPERLHSESKLFAYLGIIDVFLVTAALVISGQTDSDFYMTYFLIIIIAALSQDLKRVVFSTVLVVVAYGFTLFVTDYQKIVSSSDIMLRLPFILIIALVYAHLVHRLRAQKMQTERTTALFEESRSEAEAQKVLRELNEDIAKLDIQNLMKKLSERMRTILNVNILDAALVEGESVKIIAVAGTHQGFLGADVLGKRGGRIVQILETREPMVLSDVSRGSASLESGPTRYPGVRGYLAVPFLSREGKVLGVLRALTYEPREFTDEEVTLLQTAANGAAVALENAKLLEDLKNSNEELERSSLEQRVLREFLSNIMLLDLNQVLQRTTEQAVRLFQADIAWFRVIDEQGRITTGAAAGNETVVKRIVVSHQDRLVGRGRWMLDNRKPLTVRDMAEDPEREYRGGVKEADLHGFLGAPLLSRAQKPLGMIYVMTRRPREFTQREIHLIEQFANGAALAIENARLVEELTGKTQQLQSANDRLQHLLEEQNALREIFMQINVMDLGQLLSQFASQALRLLKVDHIQIRLLDKNGNLDTVALAGGGSERFRNQTGQSGKGRSTWIMENRQPMAIHDVSQDMYFGPGRLMREMGVKGYLGVPLVSREYRSIGVLLATHLEARTFSHEEIALAQQLAAGATVAIENARLFEEVQEASKKIEEAFRTKTAFMNTMAHELRTPLNVILGVYQLFAEGIYGELTGEQKEAWDRVRRNAEDLLNLIDEILDLVRLESKKVPLRVEEFPVTKLTDELQSAFYPLARKKGLDLKLNVDNGAALIKSDESKIKEIMQNLLANAIKYTDSGEVELSTTLTNGEAADEKQMIHFAVRDSGIGIKETDLPHVFEAFYLVEDVDRQKYPGTGLGLCIVKRLAELLGGDVQVRSEHGKGSTFTVSLPLVHSSANQ